jgi:hypothetical protein
LEPELPLLPLPEPLYLFDEQVRVIDEEGIPIPNCPYLIEDEEGNSYHGFTDKDGCCSRIYTKNAQDIIVYLGVSALERMAQ